MNPKFINGLNKAAEEFEKEAFMGALRPLASAMFTAGKMGVKGMGSIAKGAVSGARAGASGVAGPGVTGMERIRAGASGLLSGAKSTMANMHPSQLRAVRNTALVGGGLATAFGAGRLSKSSEEKTANTNAIRQSAVKALERIAKSRVYKPAKIGVTKLKKK